MADLNNKESQEEDFEAVKRVLSGDNSAFRVLQNKYQRLIASLIRRMVKDEDDIQDLTQETFIKAYNAMDTFKFGYTFSAWIYRIASNNCIDFLRKKRFQTVSLSQPLYDDEDDYFLQVEDSTFRPDLEYISQEIKQAITHAIDKLPENYREIIKLRHEMELDYSEISKKLDMPLGTVKAHLFRARKLLLSELKNKRQLFMD
ncbi:sigma-70 family RNA polymerase sigma factor [Bacteroidota bacterium]